MRKWHIPSLLTIFVHSPVDIQIESPSGEKLGKNFDTNGIYDEIEGAYYTGFDTKSEFITIPNPEDGEYKIITKGTGEGGNYSIEAVKISENPDDPDNAKESSVTIEGETQISEIQEYEMEVVGDKVIYNPDTTPPEIRISSPEEREYTNNEVLKIDFEVEDSESGIADTKWQIEKDGQLLVWKEKTIDLSLEHLGNYILKVAAIDNAGNPSKKQVEFSVTTDIDAIQKNADHYFRDLNLISSPEEFDYYRARLAHIKALFDRLGEERKNKKPFEKIQKEIRQHIDHLIDHIQRSASVYIDPKVAELLIEDLNTIKNF